MRSRWVALLGLVSLFLALIGCGENIKVLGGKEPEKSRWVRVVSLSPSSTEIFGISLGLTTMVGRSASCDTPAGVKSLPVVMTGVKPNYEAIKKLNPDGVIYDSSLFSKDEIAKISAMGIDSFDTHATNLADLSDKILKLGALTGAETSASASVDRALAMAESKKDLTLGNPKVAIVLPGQGSEHYIAGTKSFQADCLRSLGAQTVGPDSDKFEPMSAETFLQTQPDIVIVGGDVAAFLKDPRMKSLGAVRAGKVFGWRNQAWLLRAGGSADKTLEMMSSLLVQATSK